METLTAWDDAPTAPPAGALPTVDSWDEEPPKAVAAPAVEQPDDTGLNAPARMTMTRVGKPLLEGRVPVSGEAPLTGPVGSVMRGYEPQPTAESLIEQRGAPVDQKVFEAVKRGLERASPPERKRIAAREDWVGDVAKTVIAGWEKHDKEAKDVGALQGLTNRVEERAASLEKQGMAPEVAKNEALRQINFGDTRASAKADESEFDFSGSKWWKEQNPFIRGGAKGAAALGSSVAGMAQFTYDILGTQSSKSAEHFKTVMDNLGKQTIGEKPGPQAWLEGAVSSIVQQLPGTAIGVGTGQAGLSLAYIAAQQFGDAYGEGKKAGLTPMENTARAAVFAAAETTGEMFSVPFAVKGLREMMKGVPTERLLAKVGEFTTGLLARELPGEAFTQTAESLADKFAPFGLTPDLKPEQFYRQMVDVVMQTTIQTALMGGAGGTLSAAAKVQQQAFPQRAFAQALADDISATYFTGAEARAKESLRPENAAAAEAVPRGTVPAPARASGIQRGSIPLQAETPEAVIIQPTGTTAPGVGTTPEMLYEWEENPPKALPAAQAGTQEAKGPPVAADVQPELAALPEGQQWDGKVLQPGQEADPLAREFARRARLRQQATESKRHSSSDGITDFVIKSGGLSIDERADVITEGNKALPFVGYLFSRNGQGLDLMASAAHDDGFLSDEEFADRGGVPALIEKIQEEYAGRRKHLRLGSDSTFEAEMQARYEQEQVDAEAQALARDAPVFAERAGLTDWVPLSEAADLQNALRPFGEETEGDAYTIADLTERAQAIDDAATERVAIQGENLSPTQYARELWRIINEGTKRGEVAQPAAGVAELGTAAERRGGNAAAAAERGAAAVEGGEAGAGGEAAAGGGVRYATVIDFSEKYLARQKEVRERVGALARQIVPKASVQFAKSLTATDARAAELSGGVEGQPVSGQFDARSNIITVALGYRQPDQALKHESIHWLKTNGFFTRQEWTLLEREAKRTWNAAYNVADAEEGIAYAFGDFRAGRLTAEGAIRRIFQRIAEFLERLGNVFRGLGFQTAEDVFTRVDAGEVGRRYVPEDVFESTDGRRYALPGKMRYTATAAQKQQFAQQAIRNLKAAQLMGPPAPTRPTRETSRLAAYLSTPRNMAAWHADFVPVYDNVAKSWQRRGILLSEFMREAEPYFALKPEPLARVNAVLEHDRLSGQIQLTGQNMVVKFSEAAAALSKPGETMTLTDAEKSAYWAVRRSMNAFLDELKDSVLVKFKLPRGLTAAQVRARIGQPPATALQQLAAIQATTPQGLQAVQNVKKQIAQAQAKYTRDKAHFDHVADLLDQIDGLRKRGYVPFSRFGQMAISVNDAATGDLREYVRIETGLGDWLALKSPGAKTFMDEPSVRAEHKRLQAKYAGQAVTISQPYKVPERGLAKGVNLADVDILADMAQVDKATWDSMRDLLERAQAKQGMRAHFFEARNVPGYSTDFRRAIAQYFVQGSGFLSRLEYSDRIEKAAGAIDPVNKYLVNYARAYVEYVDNPQEELSFIRQTNFLYTLTSPATWMVNLTQPYIVTAPWAAQFATPAQVTAALTRAAADAFKMLTLSNGFTFYDAKFAPKDIGAAKVQEWFDNGGAVPLSTLDAIGVAQGREPAVGLQRGDQILVDTLAAGFTVSERLNRLTTLIAMYRLARDNPEVKENFARVMAKNELARQTVIERWSPDAFAIFANEDTNFVQGKLNRQPIARGVGVIPFQMKNFTYNSVELWARSAMLAGKEGKAAVALMMLEVFLVGGLWALPGAEDMAKLYEALYKLIAKVDFDTRAYIRKKLNEHFGSVQAANFVAGGATAAAPDGFNADLQKRIGFGKLMPWDAGEALGVSYSTFFRRPANAMHQFAFENYLLGVSEFFPRLAQDPMVAASWATQGIRSQSSNAVLIPKEKVTPGMVAQKAGGLTSTSVSQVREREFAETRLRHATDEKRHVIYSRLAVAAKEAEDAYRMMDDKGLAEANQKMVRIIGEVDKWNAEHELQYQIPIQAQNIRRALIREHLGAEDNRSAPRQTRQAIEEMQKLYQKGNE